MHTLTAIIRAQKGSEALVHAELLKVGLYVKEYEPKTIGYFVAQDLEDPCVFSTYERFTDKAAMEQHQGDSNVQRLGLKLLLVLVRSKQIFDWLKTDF